MCPPEEEAWGILGVAVEPTRSTVTQMVLTPSCKSSFQENCQKWVQPASQAANSFPTEPTPPMVTDQNLPGQIARKMCKEGAGPMWEWSVLSHRLKIGGVCPLWVFTPAMKTKPCLSCCGRGIWNSWSQVSPLVSLLEGYQHFLLCYSSAGGREERALEKL